MSAARAPLTADDLAAFAFVNEAVISPAGDRVAYAVRRMDVEENRYRAALFVSGVDGSLVAQWTDGTAEDATPRWSPDGKRIAFVSERGAVPEGKKRAPKNVFIADGPGAEPRQIASFADDCGDLVWLRSGSGVIVTLKDAVAPDPDDAPKVYDRIRYRSDEAGLLDIRRKHLWLVPLEPMQGEPRKLTDGDWDDTQPAVSPDGAVVAFTSNRTADRDRNTVSDIWTIPLAGGAPVRVTTERGQYTNASWSPDGASIACLGTVDAVGASARNTRVWRFPRGGGTGSDLLGDWDRTTGSRVMGDIRGEATALAPVWTRDGRILFIGSDQGSANLYSCHAEGGGVRAETLGAPQLVTATVDHEARCFAGVLATATSPGEVVSGQPGGGMRAITDLNGDLLRERYIAEPERVSSPARTAGPSKAGSSSHVASMRLNGGRSSSRSMAVRTPRMAIRSSTSSTFSREGVTRSSTRTRAAATGTARRSCERASVIGAARTTWTSWPASTTPSGSGGSTGTGCTSPAAATAGS